MKRIVFCFVLCLLVPFGVAFASGGAHWGYSGHEGPEHWGELDESFEMFAKGVNQSPVDLTDFIEAELPSLEFNYKASATEVVNNGHTVQVNFGAGSAITSAGHTFELKQFHFHSPSENVIDGVSYPLEAHFVHADENGNLAVGAVMFEEGKENETLAKIVADMPEGKGDKREMSGNLAASLLPADKDYYRFNGSLTTPPCSEGVWWHVMKGKLSLSAEQLDAFKHAMLSSNNRPLQPVNARPILK